MIINRTGAVVRERGLSMSQLSEQADISYNTALNMVRGMITRIDLPVLDRICKVLHAQPGDLLVWVEDQADQSGKMPQKPKNE